MHIIVITITFFGIFLSCKPPSAINRNTAYQKKMIKEKTELIEAGVFPESGHSAPVPRVSKVTYFDESGRPVRELRYNYPPFGDTLEQQIQIEQTSETAPDGKKTVKTTYRCDQWNFANVEICTFDASNVLLVLEFLTVAPDGIEVIKKCTYTAEQGKIFEESCKILITDQVLIGKYQYTNNELPSSITYLEADTGQPVMEEVFEYNLDHLLHKTITFNIRSPIKTIMRTVRYEYKFW